MLAGRPMDILVLAVTAATAAELLADRRPVPALVAATCGLALLARRRAPAVAITIAFAGLLVLTAILNWHDPAGAFGLTLLTFVVAGGLRPEWAAWTGWACGMAEAAVAEDMGGGGAPSDILLTLAFCSALFGMSLPGRCMTSLRTA